MLPTLLQVFMPTGSVELCHLVPQDNGTVAAGLLRQCYCSVPFKGLRMTLRLSPTDPLPTSKKRKKNTKDKMHAPSPPSPSFLCLAEIGLEIEEIAVRSLSHDNSAHASAVRPASSEKSRIDENDWMSILQVSTGKQLVVMEMCYYQPQSESFSHGHYESLLFLLSLSFGECCGGPPRIAFLFQPSELSSRSLVFCNLLCPSNCFH